MAHGGPARLQGAAGLARSQGRARSGSRAAEFDRRSSGDLPSSLAGAIDTLKSEVATEQPALATRSASQRVLEAINPVIPETIGGSADLTGSNNTKSGDMSVVSGG